MTENLSARFKSISSIGEVEIEFNSIMRIPTDLKRINSTIADFHIVPALNRQNEDTFKKVHLNM